MKKVKKVLALALTMCMLAGMTLNVSATELPADADVASENTVNEEQKSSADTSEANSETESVAASEEIAEAEEETTEAAATGYARATEADPFYKIVHLDAGRKYFTKDWVIALLHEMQAAGYNYLELAFGNDGLRFLLDDMSVTVNETTYKDADVTAGIQKGNKTYHNCGTNNEWTQNEMDEIISAAKECGIQIIPLLNTPGHMNAILDAMEDVGITDAAYSGSGTTVDITNTSAVAFTQALVQKYITYFANKGCTIFNIGTDEYANDIYNSGSMGFGALQSNGQYDEFVTYVNSLATMVKNANMTPMAFNDGIYYNDVTADGKFDSDILISYWSSGWSGYEVASASFLANQGHRLVNTHGTYYYVLGKNDEYTQGSNTTHDPELYTVTSGFNNSNFMGSDGLIAAGSMFCIWCDYPNAETETEIAQNTRLIIRAMGKRMADESITDMDTSSVVANGFNADGTINTDNNSTDTEVTDGGNVTLVVNGKDTKEQNGLATALTQNDVTVNDSSIVDVTVTSKANTGSAETKVTLGSEVTAIESGKKYVISSETNALATSGTSGTSFTNVTRPEAGAEVGAAALWTITKDGDGYTISQEINGETYYLGYSSSQNTGVLVTNYTYTLALSTGKSVWNYSDGQFQQSLVTKNYWLSDSDDVSEKFYIRFNNNWQMSTTASAVTLNSVVETTIPGTTTYDHTITFTGKAIGTTEVTVGNVRYTVEVKSEDLAGKQQAVEFWITNRPVTANSATSMMIEAAAGTVNSEAGAKISELVPFNGTQDGKDVVFWKGTRLAEGNEQTNDSGVDKTKSGNDFTYIRYWNSKWSYSSDGSQWSDIADGDQIVAYYLQKTEVTSEITTNVVDWGQPYSEWKEGQDNDWFWGGYVENGSKFIFLDFAVVYEDGTQNPDAFPVNNTLFYHFDGNSASNPRVLGATTFTENEEFEIWKVTVQDGTCTGYSNVNSFEPTYSGEETVVWDESMGGEPHIDDLTYYANRSGKLVRVYVRAKVTEDSLKVHYVDQTAGNNEFYSYNIAVKEGTLFNEGFALGQDKNTLVNNTVVNIKDVTQTVTADLSTMSEIGAQYRYSEYECVKVERSADGKEVYLYYTFNNTHNFVVDFGLPLVITQNDINIEGDWSNATIAGAQYGTATVAVGQGITYTPTKVLQGVESLQLTLSDSEGTVVTHQIYIYPATTVYYEEGFAASTQFTGGTTGSGNQETAAPGDVAESAAFNYGRDDAYDTMENSNSQSKAVGDGATFEFTGTGVDIYANCTKDTGMVLVQIKDANGSIKKMMTVDTVLKTGTIDSEHGLANIGTAYNVPIVSVANELGYGKYTVIMKHVKRSGTDTTADGILLDGFRVYGTLNNVDDTVYAKDNEQSPQYSEVRNAVLTTLNAEATDSEQYAGQIAKNLMSQVYATGSGSGALILTKSGGYTNEDLQDLLDNCSKNELYLYPGQTLVFKLANGTINPQLGLKALNGDVQYSVNSATGTTLSANTDMFYPITMGAEAGGTTFTVKNTGNSGILSVTKLKNANVAAANTLFAELTEEDLMPALMSMGFETEPTVEYADAAANINLVDYTGKVLATTALTANGEAGTDAVFAADSIKAAAEQMIPEGYAFADASKIADQTVKYGESADVNVQVGKVATLNVTYKRWGKTVGTATLTGVQTSADSKYTFSASEIRDAAPNGCTSIKLFGTKVKFGSTGKITVQGF